VAASDTTVCLTIDIDWALDEVIQDTLTLINRFACPATWFATHDTPMLREISASDTHEIGLHPNFNSLLEGSGSDARQTLAALRHVAPEARSIRSHSLTRSSRLACLFAQGGFTHESNLIIPPNATPELWCWRDFSGLVQAPIRWEDDVRLLDATLGDPVDVLGRLRLLTVDVHPIHVFLNTMTIDDYEGARPHFGNFMELDRRRRSSGSGGTRDRLIALLERTRSEAVPAVRMRDLVPFSSQA
jgi:hypothetical protein